MNLYVGNLALDVTDEDLKQAFEVYGTVKSSKVVKDYGTGQSRGFGFVEMPSMNQALEAISGLNGQDVKGKSLVVSEARPKKTNPRGGGRGGRGGGGGGGNRRW